MVRELDAMNSMAELNEENLWSAPTGPNDNRPWGIPYWIQKDASTTPGGGFNGGNPTGFSGGAGGIDSSLYPKWKNWTFGYTNVTTDDLIKKVKKALRYCKFMPPHKFPETGFGDFKFEMFTVYDVLEKCERLAEQRNDNLGVDLAKYMGAVMIGGFPMRWVPYLTDNDSTNPIYGINWKVFRPFVKKGCMNRRHPPKPAANQHNVREVHIDTVMNYLVTNRRSTFVGSVAA